MPSATRQRWISVEHTPDTGIFVGGSTEHPAPSTNATLPPPGDDTACSNSGGRGITDPQIDLSTDLYRMAPHRLYRLFILHVTNEKAEGNPQGKYSLYSVRDHRRI